jgi:hypothetical protein
MKNVSSSRLPYDNSGAQLFQTPPRGNFRMMSSCYNILSPSRSPTEANTLSMPSLEPILTAVLVEAMLESALHGLYSLFSWLWPTYLGSDPRRTGVPAPICSLRSFSSILFPPPSVSTLTAPMSIHNFSDYFSIGSALSSTHVGISSSLVEDCQPY